MITFPDAGNLSAFMLLSSMKRAFSGRAGHGRMLDAETVTTAAKKVAAKRDDAKVRCWTYLRALDIVILSLKVQVSQQEIIGEQC